MTREDLRTLAGDLAALWPVWFLLVVILALALAFSRW